MKHLVLAGLFFGAWISSAQAATLYANPATWALIDLLARPGDEVVLENGIYPPWTFAGSRVTYRARSKGGAFFPAIATSPGSDRLTFIGIKAKSVTLAGTNLRLSRMTVAESPQHGILIACRGTESPCEHPSGPVRIFGTDVSGAARHGIKIEGAAGVSLLGVRSHDNGGSGLFDEATNAGLRVLGGEFDHNGLTTGEGSGLKVGGKSGLLRSNLVHDNALYGIECWPGCYGTADAPYVIERNRVWSNGRAPDWWHGGSGIGVGGYAEEPNPPSDARPHYVTVRGNRVRDEAWFGIYVLCSCDDAAQGDHVRVTGNDVAYSAVAQIGVARCDRMTDLGIDGNTMTGNGPFARSHCSGKGKP